MLVDQYVQVTSSARRFQRIPSTLFRVGGGGGGLFAAPPPQVFIVPLLNAATLKAHTW